jgi:hypothetical protein
MIREDVHDRLKEIYDEFDHHCRINNVDYSIDADYYNVQGYRLLDGHNAIGVLRHIANYVKDRPVNLEYNGHAVNYDDLKSTGFNISTYNPLFKFTLESIQEDEMLNEDQYKGPTNAHGRRQAAFPSSSRNLKTRDTYEGEGGGKKKTKKKDKDKSESLIRHDKFEDRLLKSINETVGLSFKDPDILFTKNDADAEEEEDLEEALKIESAMLRRYLASLEKSEDELTSVLFEGMVERCNKQITSLNRLIKERDGIDQA